MAEDDLAEACSRAPKFGMNAKALILQAALAADDEPAPQRPGGPLDMVVQHEMQLGAARTCSQGQPQQQRPDLRLPDPCALQQADLAPPCHLPAPAGADATAEAAAAIARRGAEYLAAVDVKQRPLAAYVPRSKVPRINRWPPCVAAGLRRMP